MQGFDDEHTPQQPDQVAPPSDIATALGNLLQRMSEGKEVAQINDLIRIIDAFGIEKLTSVTNAQINQLKAFI